MAKKLLIVSVLGLLLSGLAFASGQQEPAAVQGAAKITLKGAVTFENLIHPTLKSGDKVYELLVPRYLAYQAGLKDGAEISIEGYLVKDVPYMARYADARDNEVFVTKATINGKDSDVSALRGGMMGGYGRGGRMMDGWGPGFRGHMF